MEKRIREYEKFIDSEMRRELSAAEKTKLADLNREMVQNFQHERLIHMIVMFFFITLTIGIIIAVGYSYIETNGFCLEMWPLYALAVIMTILSICYVKHYYFLENHVQKLYDTTMKLYKK